MIITDKATGPPLDDNGELHDKLQRFYERCTGNISPKRAEALWMKWFTREFMQQRGRLTPRKRKHR